MEVVRDGAADFVANKDRSPSMILDNNDRNATRNFRAGPDAAVPGSGTAALSITHFYHGCRSMITVF
jgi:hypothetical protein